MATSGDAMGKPALLGTKILVVEGNFLIATDLKSAFEAESAMVCGPFGTSEEALDLLDRLRPDCALLELFIGDTMTVPLAEKLRRLNIPYVLVSAYPRDGIPKSMRNAPFVGKPYRHEDVVEAVVSTLRKRRCP